MEDCKLLNKFNVLILLMYSGFDIETIAELIIRRREELGLPGLTLNQKVLVIGILMSFVQRRETSTVKLMNVLTLDLSLKIAS